MPRDDSWMDREAARLEQKAEALIRKYQRLDRIASWRVGDSRLMYLERMISIRDDHAAIISKISRLRSRAKI